MRWLLMIGRSFPEFAVRGWPTDLLTIEFEIGSSGILEGLLVFDLQVKIHLSPSTPLTTFAFVKFGNVTVRKANVATEKKNISHLL
jgi:hypothetical protein